MRALDIFSLILAVLGAYAVFLSPRFLLPFYVIPHIEAQLVQTGERLHEAEASNTIPSESEYRDRFTSRNKFSQMRTASNESSRFLQQVRLTSLSCLTYKLYTLSSRIRALHREIEMVIDEHRLVSVAPNQNATARPAHAPITATPMVDDVAEPTPPQPATPGRPSYPSRLMRVPQTAMDEHQLATIAFYQNIIVTALPAPVAVTTTPTVNDAEPIPPPVAHSRLTYPSRLMVGSQMAMDDHQPASAASSRTATATAPPAPATNTAAPQSMLPN